MSNSIVTGAVLIAGWFFVYRRLTTDKREDQIAKAIDPVTGNPAIVDPPLRAGIGDGKNTAIPYSNERVNRLIKPYDSAATSIFSDKQYMKNYDMAWKSHVWDSEPNSVYLRPDSYTGNLMSHRNAGKILTVGTV